MIKELQKGMVFVFIGIFFCSLVFASSGIFYKGSISGNFLNNYSAGENIQTSIELFNNEDFPLAKTYLVIEMVKGKDDLDYPSQFSNKDIVFHEEIIKDINIGSGKRKNIPFSFKIPENLAQGKYRVDLFWKTERTPIVGIPHIFLPGKSYHFDILNSSGDFPFAKILRTKTNIRNETGPIGVSLGSSENFVLDVYVDSNKTFLGNLNVEICNWDDTVCNPVSETSKNVEILSKKQMIPIELTSPKKSGAYSVRIELNSGNNLVSLYRSRIIVRGKAARIRKLNTDKYHYNDEIANVFVLAGGSPDHYTKPVLEDVDLEVSLENLENEEKETSKKNIGSLSSDNFPESFYENASFSFRLDGEWSNFKVCSTLSSNENIYDSSCYNVNSSKFGSNEHSISLGGDFNEKEFLGELCIRDKITNSSVNADIFLLVKKDNEIIRKFSKDILGCTEISFPSSFGEEYNVLVQDRTTSQDMNFYLENDVQSKEEKSSLFFLILMIVSLLIVLLVFFLIISLIKFLRGKNE